MHRSEYMGSSEKAGAHRAYFGQYVTDSIVSRVVAAIGAERIRASTDPHLNDIPLPLWDSIALQINSGKLSKQMRDNGDWASLGTLVCVAKEAARQFKERPAPATQ